jgi:hypothetical protein
MPITTYSVAVPEKIFLSKNFIPTRCSTGLQAVLNHELVYCLIMYLLYWFIILTSSGTDNLIANTLLKVGAGS